MGFRHWLQAAFMAMVVLGCVSFSGQSAAPTTPIYPTQDTYFGQTITDNYRWLEDQKSPESKLWMRSQADHTRALLDSMPGRANLLAEMTKYQNAGAYVVNDPHPIGDVLFFRKRLRGENQASLYIRDASGVERKLLDPEALSTREHHVTLNSYLPSHSGQYVVLALSSGGSEDATCHILNVSTGQELPDRLPRCWEIIPNPDDDTVFYVALEELAAGAPKLDKYRHPRTVRHRIGSSVTEDEIILQQGTSPEIPVADFTTPVAAPTANSAYVMAAVVHDVDTYRELFVGPAEALTKHQGWHRLCSMNDKCSDATLVGDSVYLVTFRHSLNGEVLRVNAAQPSLVEAEVVMQATATVLAGRYIGRDVLFPAKDALYVSSMDRGYGTDYRISYGKGGRAKRVPVPAGLGMIYTYSDPTTNGPVMQLMSWTSPGDFYRFAPGMKQAQPMQLVPQSEGNPANLAFEEVMVKSWDGTAVPLSIIHRNDVKRDGKTPTLMVGYGAYGDSSVPGYSRRSMAWLERGNLLVMTHVRGGGELGEAWHLAGKQATKPNTWRDFIACAQYLIDKKYTDAAHLGIQGQSAGGVLIGRSITERPDLFAAAVDGVPLADALRFETSPNGPGNVPEFGSVKTEAGFRALYEMSSYHHVKSGVNYPAVLVTAGANDPRIEPWQGGKMAAALQAAQAGSKPILLRVNYDSGHGNGDPVAQQVSDWTDYFSFLLWNFGVEDFQPTAALKH